MSPKLRAGNILGKEFAATKTRRLMHNSEISGPSLIILAIRRRRAERSSLGNVIYEMDFFFAGLIAIVAVSENDGASGHRLRRAQRSARIVHAPAAIGFRVVGRERR